MAGNACRRIGNTLGAWARSLQQDVVALWIAARDPRVPWPAKALAGATAAYALSPIDLIPDVIPILGYLDDLLIVPAGIWLALRLIPPPLLAEFRELAAQREGRPVSMAGALTIILLWMGTLVACAYWLGWVAA